VVFLFPDPRYLFVKADLLGDDISTPSDPAVAVPGGHKTNEDLLAEIFGGLTAMTTTTDAATPTSASSQPQKTTAADILGLFDSPTPSASPQAQQAPPTAAASLFDLSTPVTPAAPPPKPAAPNLPSYNAYNKNDVVISLTPQRSTTQPGVVDILARFQVKGSITATGLNFQVAVPKVSNNSPVPPSSTYVPDDVYFFLSFHDRQHRHNSYKCSPCHVRMSTPERQRHSKCALLPQLA
jgi:AP-1 complex subunit gamma-1